MNTFQMLFLVLLYARAATAQNLNLDKTVYGLSNTAACPSSQASDAGVEQCTTIGNCGGSSAWEVETLDAKATEAAIFLFPGQLAGINALEMFVVHGAVQKRTVKAITINSANPACNYPGPNWIKGVESNSLQCYDVYKSNIPWSTAYRGGGTQMDQMAEACDLRREEVGGLVAFLGEATVSMSEMFEFDGQEIERTIDSVIRFNLTQPKTITDITVDVRVFEDPRLLRAVTEQTFDYVSGFAKLKLLLSIGDPLITLVDGVDIFEPEGLGVTQAKVDPLISLFGCQFSSHNPTRKRSHPNSFAALSLEKQRNIHAKRNAMQELEKFPCGGTSGAGDIYQIRELNGETSLNRISITGSQSTFVTVHTIDQSVNGAWGMWGEGDGNAYGLVGQEVWTVDVNEGFKLVGLVPEVPNSVIYAGEVMPNGILVAKTTTELIMVDITTRAPTYVRTVQMSQSAPGVDVAYNPADGLLYGADSNRDQLYWVDPESGRVTHFGPNIFTGSYGALFFDKVGGILYGFDNPTGKLWYSPVGSEGSGAATLNALTQGEPSGSNDGVSCRGRPPVVLDFSIGGQVYVQLRANDNTSYVGIDGVTIDLAEGDTILAQTSTAAGGFYSFRSLLVPEMLPESNYTFQINTDQPTLKDWVIDTEGAGGALPVNSIVIINAPTPEQGTEDLSFAVPLKFSGKNSCQQEHSYTIDPQGSCDFDGVYTFDIPVACREDIRDTPDCPLDMVAEPIRIEVTLDSEDICAVVQDLLQINATLTSHREFEASNFTFGPQQSTFFQGDTLQFRLQADSINLFPFETTTLDEVRIAGSNGSELVLYNKNEPQNTLLEFQHSFNENSDPVAHVHQFQFQPGNSSVFGTVNRNMPVDSAVEVDISVVFFNSIGAQEKRKRTLRLDNGRKRQMVDNSAQETAETLFTLNPGPDAPEFVPTTTVASTTTDIDDTEPEALSTSAMALSLTAFLTALSISLL